MSSYGDGEEKCVWYEEGGVGRHVSELEGRYMPIALVGKDPISGRRISVWQYDGNGR